MLKKIYSLITVLIVLFQVGAPLAYNASEIYSDLLLENSEVEGQKNITSETKSDITSDAKSETKSDITSETKSDITSETKSDITSETKSDITSETKSDITSETKSDITSDAKSETKSDISSRYQPLVQYWYDKSDAPASYGEIQTTVATKSFSESDRPGEVDAKYQGSPAQLAQKTHMGLYLGYDAPDTDPDDLTYASDSANLDDIYGALGDEEVIDEGYAGMEEYDAKFFNDDETAFENKVSLADGSIQYNPYETSFNLSIPYTFSKTVQRIFDTLEDAQAICGEDAEAYGTHFYCYEAPNPITDANLLMWIDTDLNGTFDADEGLLVEDVAQYDYVKETTASFSKPYHTLRVNYDMSALDFDSRAKLMAEDTYMRLVLTSDTDYGVDDASISPADGTYGEIEDYKLTSIEATDYGYVAMDNPEMNPTNVDASKVDDGVLVYENIESPFSEKAVDIKITITGGIEGDIHSGIDVATFMTYSESNEPVDLAIGATASPDNPIEFTMEFFETGTEIPVEQNITLRFSDFDKKEYLKLDQIPDYQANESDAQYLYDGLKEVHYTTTPAITWVPGLAGEYDMGSANKQLFTFNNVTSISGQYSNDYGRAEADGFELQVSYPLTSLERPTPNFEVDKSSTPVGDGSVDVVTGDTISYEIDAKTTTDSDVGVQITDPLDEDLTYVADSAELLLNGTDVTTDATVEYVAADNELEVTYDHDIVAGDEFVLNFDATVGDEVGPYTIENTATVSDAKDFVEFTTPTTEHNVKANTEVTIDKALVESNTNGYIDIDEDLTYTISVTNPSTTTPATGIEIRDSLLEELPAYLSYDGSVVVEAADNSYTGSLSAGDFVLARVAPGETATITYTVHVDSVPDGVEGITNIATDGGLDPITECDATTTDDCSEVTLPADGYTVISKEVNGLGSNDLVDRGETLEYTVNVNNPGTRDANSVEVRDSMLENLDSLPWITFNDDIVVAPESIATTGNLIDGDFVIETVAAGEEVNITYSVTVTDRIPEDVASLENIATDDGREPTVDPDCDETTSDCGAIVESKVNPETLIDKSVEESIPNEAIDLDEDLTYKIEVTNPNTEVSSYDVAVRDSMLEDLPTNISFDGSVAVDGSTYSGDLTDGTFVLDEVKAESTVTISYTVHVDSLPTDFNSLTNIATDGGLDPITECDATTTDECSEITLPANGNTVISKEVNGLGSNDLVDRGETLEYTVNVNNPGTRDANSVEVRDSMLENLDSFPWLTFNDDIVVAPESIATTGNLIDGDFVIETVAAGEEVNITYSVTVTDRIPEDVASLENIATDDGREPTVDPDCDETTSDCGAIVESKVNPETLIDKSVEESTPNGVIDLDEDLTYKIEVTNSNTEVSSYDVAVRDSMLEELPTNISFDGIVVVDGSTYSGDLTDGTFVLDEVKAESTVTISYTVHVDSLPSDFNSLTNIATDGGLDPITECGATTTDECSEVTLPANGNTVISKEVNGLGSNDLVDRGETLEYTVNVDNPGTRDAVNVIVRDSMLENLDSFPWITFNDDIVVAPESVATTGNLIDGDFVIETVAAGEEVNITYSVTVTDRIPEDVASLENIATDDGREPTVDPDCDETTSDCGAIVESKVNPETLIDKSVEESTPNGVIDLDEDLTYKIEVTNSNTEVSSYDVAVRDSMLEDLPTNISFDGIVVVDGSTYSGDLTDGTFVLDEVKAESTVTISYTVHVDSLPSDFNSLTNIATDGGLDPITECDVTTTDECSEITLPANGNTVISKEVKGLGSNDLVDRGETLEYTVNVNNPGTEDANNVEVRDSMLENLDSLPWITFNDDIVVTPESVATTGSLIAGDFVIETVAAGEEVNITYSVTVTDRIPEDVASLENIATDDGREPTVDPDCDETISDCGAIVESKVNPETLIDKSVEESTPNGVIDLDEDLTYKIEVTNSNTEVSSYDVAVRDSMLEDLPTNISFDGIVVVDGSTYSGDLTDGTFVLDEVEPGSTVTISYTVHVDSLPTDFNSLTNIATDGGLDPITECGATTTDECSEVTLPADGYTVISKEVNGLGSNDLVDRGETLEYTVNVNNPGTRDANSVEVRDSMLENLDSLPWITFNDDIVVAPESVATTGNLIDGDFVIETVAAGEEVNITYSVTVTDRIPEDVASLENIATDDGREPTVDPDCDETTSDCGAFVESKVNPETLIDKSVEESTPNGAIDLDEDLTYKINVTNPNTEVSSYDVAVRDSMLEDLPTNISFDGSVVVDGSTYSGDLTDGTFVLDEVKPESTVTITYTVHVDSLPSDFNSLTNIATDTGDKPEPDCDTDDECGEVTLPVNGSTTITKEVDGLGDNEIVDSMETLTYTLTIDNSSDYDALNVPVRDSMLENLDSFPWITFNEDLKVAPKLTNTTGSLTDGTFVINKIEKGSTVTITYSITVGDEIPSDVDVLPNVATNNGKDPIIDPDCDEAVESCGAIVTPDVNPSTMIKKTVQDENNDGFANGDEDLVYTIDVTNTNLNVSAYDVPVRDSMLENLPSNIEWDGAVVVDGSDTIGDLAAGDFVLTEIKPGETATITYTVHINELSADDQIENIATDNGDEPSIEKCTNSNNCTSVTLPPIKVIEEDIVGTTSETITEIASTNNSDETDKSMSVTGSESSLIIILLTLISTILIILKFRLNINNS